MYANMAKEQLEGALEGDGDDDGNCGGVLSSGARVGPCVNRKQQRIRADLMLTVLYDMLGRYDESDEYLDAAFHVRRLFSLYVFFIHHTGCCWVLAVVGFGAVLEGGERAGREGCVCAHLLLLP